jgi:predicted nucleotide-binding protein
MGIEAVILLEQANRGRTIVQKFEETADDIAFAVVLVTRDDLGRLSISYFNGQP